MNPFFSIFSAIYIFGIYFWADSPVVAQISVFNPFSLLHIPLYGVLTIFLVLALRTDKKEKSKFRYLLVALIALTVAALDEFHQSFIPSRDGSILDVLLDIVGVISTLFLFHRVPPFLCFGLRRKLKKVGANC